MCKKILSCNMHSSTIFSCTHILRHHFNFHWLHLKSNGFSPFFLKTPDQYFEFSSDFFQVNIPTHAEFMFKWSFWDGLQTPLRLLSPRRFCKWILTIVSTLLSYCRRSHSMSNYTYLWGSMPFRHDQALGWSLSHCHKRSIVLTHKSYFMPSISQCLCNIFLPTPIQNSNQGWMWKNNPWHLGPSL